MRLPGVEYRQVESMGRMDPSLPVAQAQAGMKKDFARAGIMSAANDAYQFMYQEESKRQAIKGIRQAEETFNARAAQQQPYDEKGTPVWNKSSEVFEDMFLKSTEQAKPNEMTGMAKVQFEEHMNKKRLEYKDKWDRQVQAWWKEDGAAHTIDATEKAVAAEDYVSAREHVENGRNFIGQMQATKLLNTIDYTEVYTNHLHTAKNIDILEKDWMLKSSEFRENTKNNDTLSLQDKDNILREHGKTVVGAHRDNMAAALGTIAKTQGIVKAVEYGEMSILQAHMSPSWKFGSDSKFKGAIVTELNAELNPYKDLARALTRNVADYSDIVGWLSGTTYTSPNHNADIPSNAFGLIVMGGELDKNGKVDRDTYTKTDADFFSSTPIQGLDGKPAQAWEVGVQVATHAGFMPKEMTGLLEAGMMRNDPQHTQVTMNVLNTLSKTPEGRRVLFSNNTNDLFRNVLAITEGYGLTNPENVQRVFNYSLEVSPEQKKAFMANLNAEDFDKAFESGFEKSLKHYFPDPGLFFDSVPGYKTNFKYQVKDLAKEFMAMTGDMDVSRGLKMAMVTMQTEYDRSTVGSKDMRVKKTPAEMVLGNPELNPTQNAEWITQYLRESVNKYAADFGTRSLDKGASFDYELIMVNDTPMIQAFTIGEDGFEQPFPPVMFPPDAIKFTDWGRELRRKAVQAQEQRETVAGWTQEQTEAELRALEGTGHPSQQLSQRDANEKRRNAILMQQLNTGAMKFSNKMRELDLMLNGPPSSEPQWWEKE